MSDTSIERADQALAKLSLDDDAEYRRYLASGKPPLALGTSLKLYELFVLGVDCHEIAKLNNLPAGAVIRARIENRWDDRKDEYLATMYASANDRLRQIGVEAVNFMGLALAAAHKDLGDHMKAYLLSGDPKDLGEFRIMSFRTYKEVVETLVKLTGADNKKTLTVKGEVVHSGGGDEASSGARLTPEQADAMRALIGKR